MAYWFEVKNGKQIWFENQRQNMLTEMIALNDGIYFYEHPKTPGYMKSVDQIRFVYKIFDIVDKHNGNPHGTTKKHLKLMFLEVPRDEVIVRLTEHFKGSEEARQAYIRVIDEALTQPVTRSLASLPMKDMHDFIENCINQVASEFGVVIETPVNGVPVKYRGKNESNRTRRARL